MARSAKRGVGNTSGDQGHLDWMEENGGLVEIDPEEEGLPFPAKLQWSGLVEDEGSPWQVPPPDKRCNGRAYVRDEDGDYVVDADGRRIKRPCLCWPIRGGTVCLAHGGGRKAVIKNANERLLGAVDRATGQLIKIIEDQDTEDSDRIRAISQLLDRVGVRADAEIDTEQPGWKKVLAELYESAPVVRRKRKAKKPQ